MRLIIEEFETQHKLTKTKSIDSKTKSIDSITKSIDSKTSQLIVKLVNW